MNNICYRNNGCRIRAHNHCNYSCKTKHEFQEKCTEYKIKSPSIKLTPSKSEIYKFVQVLNRKYNFDYKISEYLENHLVLNTIERIWLYDTFLSVKAISKETSIQWLKTYLDICFKYKNCSVMFIMFAELLYPSYRYNYIMTNVKFIKTLEKKYIEFINYEDKVFVELFKKKFFKNILELVLKIRTNI